MPQESSSDCCFNSGQHCSHKGEEGIVERGKRAIRTSKRRGRKFEVWPLLSRPFFPLASHNGTVQSTALWLVTRAEKWLLAKKDPLFSSRSQLRFTASSFQIRVQNYPSSFQQRRSGSSRTSLEARDPGGAAVPARDDQVCAVQDTLRLALTRPLIGCGMSALDFEHACVCTE